VRSGTFAQEWQAMARIVFIMKHMYTIMAMLALCGQARAESDNDQYSNIVREAVDWNGRARSLLHSNDVLQARRDKYKSKTQEIDHRSKRIRHDAHTANQDFKYARGFRDHGRKLLERSGDYIRKHEELRAEVRHWKKAEKEATKRLDKHREDRSEARSNRHIARRGTPRVNNTIQ